MVIMHIQGGPSKSYRKVKLPGKDFGGENLKHAKLCEGTIFDVLSMVET